MILKKAIVSISASKLLDTYYICTWIYVILNGVSEGALRSKLSFHLDALQEFTDWPMRSKAIPSASKKYHRLTFERGSFIDCTFSILNRLRPPYLVVVSDSGNNTGNCSARKLSMRWWSESVMRQFSRIEKKGNLLLLDNKRTETSFPSYISHFILLNLSLTFWILKKVLILQVSAICMLIFTYLQKPQFWINKTAGDNKVVIDYEQPLVILSLFLFRGKNSDIKKKEKLLTPYHLHGLCLR